MFDDGKYREKAAKIRELVLKSRLKPALEGIQMMLADARDWSVQSQADDLTSQYGLMLKYFAQGAADSSRSELFRKLQVRILLLADSALVACLKEQSMTLYYQHLRSKSLGKVTLDSTLAVLESEVSSDAAKEKAVCDLFDLIWTSGLWTANDCEDLYRRCQSSELEVSNTLLVLGAVLISLFERFDPQKMLFLCLMARNSDSRTAVRALTGLSLATVRYSDILYLFPQVESGISMLADADRVPELMAEICLGLLMTRQTDEIGRRMREEIIPTMLNNSKLGDIVQDVFDSGTDNPDWKDSKGKSAVRDRLIEMTELQMEGADVYMSTFSNLKNYPFFKEPGNWFREFSLQQPDVKASLGDSGIEKSVIGKSMLFSSTFCNSDKYSFALTFSHIPENQRGLLTGGLGEQLEQELSEALDKPIGANAVSERQAIRQYCQDLYRFFNLFSRKHEFFNPFECNVNLLENNYLAPIVNSSGLSYKIALWLLEKHYFAESSVIYQDLESRGDSHAIDYRYYQQMGYAFQRCGKLDQALEAYVRADLLESDNIWTLRHIAHCYRELGKSDKALEQLMFAEKIKPDDMSLQIETGDCLVDMKRYDDALSRFFKVDYLKPDYPKAWRAIAWCAFLAGRYDRSLEYYGRLASLGENGTDFLNAGHVCWVSGDIQLAISNYGKALELLGEDKFMNDFSLDRPTLLEKGIAADDIILMLDSLIP